MFEYMFNPALTFFLEWLLLTVIITIPLIFTCDYLEKIYYRRKYRLTVANVVVKPILYIR